MNVIAAIVCICIHMYNHRHRHTHSKHFRLCVSQQRKYTRCVCVCVWAHKFKQTYYMFNNNNEKKIAHTMNQTQHTNETTTTGWANQIFHSDFQLCIRRRIVWCVFDILAVWESIQWANLLWVWKKEDVNEKKERQISR